MRKPKAVIAASIPVGTVARQKQPLGCTGALRKHAVADEAEADAGNHRKLADPPAQGDGGRQNVGGRFVRAHHLKKPHHVRG